MNGLVMESRKELNQKLRHSILSLAGVSERQNAGIHKEAFFVAPCSCISMGTVTATFDCRNVNRSGFLWKAKHALTAGRRKQGYVTFIVPGEEELAVAMDLIRMSQHHFAAKQGALETL